MVSTLRKNAFRRDERARLCPVTPEHAVFPSGVYHAYDYALFYENLKANAAERIRAFQTKWSE
jgi:hypothetical protein